MENSPVIEAKKLYKTFGKAYGVSSLSFSIYKNEKIALIGPSGAGKSTLLNLISKTLERDGGELLIDGKNIDAYSALREYSKKVGIISQSLDLVLDIPVIHNVLAGNLGRWSNLKALLSLIYPSDKKQARDALERVGIGDKIFSSTRSLSGGEKQRVAIARLIVQSPEIVLADEPVASLDPLRAKDVIGLLCSLADEKDQTFIASIHSVGLALEHFDRVIGLRKGKIIIDEKTSDIDEQMLAELYAFEGE